jgi:hypothetical protein
MSDLYHTAAVALPALYVTLGGTLNDVLANGNILRCIYVAHVRLFFRPSALVSPKRRM